MRAGAAANPRGAAPRTQVKAGTSWPLVGREQELLTIAQALASPASKGIVVAGAAGLGKTRLARESLAMAERRGWATVQVVGLKATSSIPLGAFSRLSLPEGGIDQRELLRRAADAVVQLAAGRRLVLEVDDAHLLDPVGAALVHHLALTGAAFVVATVRTGEPAPDPVAALWKDELADRLELQALSLGEVERLLEEVLDGYVEVGTSYRLWSSSGGNVLFLRELVRGGLETGALTRGDGIWRWRGALTEGRRLVDVIEGRLGELDAAEREALEVMAEAEVLGVASLQRLVPASVLVGLEERGVLTVASEGKRTEVRLAHPLYGDLLRGRSRFRARTTAARLADELEATGARRREDLLRLATWRLEAGERLAPELALAGARRAEGLVDHQLAERLAQAAEEGGVGFDSRLLRGQALAGQRRGGEAAAHLAALESSATTDEERARAAIARARNLMFNLNQPYVADGVLKAAEDAISDERWRDELALARAHFLIFGGRLIAAAAAAQPVLDRPDAGEAQRLAALLTTVTVWGIRGELSRAMRGIDEGLLLAERLGEEFPQADTELRTTLGLCLTFAGRVVEAGAMAAEHYRRALDRNRPDAAAGLGMCCGYTALWRGQVRRAERILLEALPLLRDHDTWGMLPVATSLLAMAAAAAGDVDAADATIAELANPTILNAFTTWTELARAWNATAHGDRRAARVHALHAAEVACDFEFRVGEAIALHDAVRLGAVDEAAGRLATLASVIEGPLATAFAEHARALGARDGDALDRVSTSFADVDCLLLAAEAAAEASTCHHQVGRRFAARTSSARARVLVARCEGARTPALEDLTLDDGHVLTSREREIAGLAARGLSSREIGDRLLVSTRTVDSHLHQVYVKLGVSRRADLARLIGSP